ncbi:MAG: PQQ-binding-like beta-propeller repeat protein [Deltaproteobacteria bacterium]|nr:PQQ-binding-like beta-propeller repeat protein [Deltaproteobacteria bacterium]
MRRLAAPVGLALLGLVSVGAGCGVLQPVDPYQGERVSVDWAEPLYALEVFPYHPVEPAQPLYVRSAQTPAGGIVVVPAKDRVVRALDAVSGKTLWSFETKGPNVAKPVAEGDDLVIASTDGHVYRVSQRNGRASWVSEFPGGAGVLSAPAIGGGRVFVTSIDNRITALDYETGERQWERKRPHLTELTVSGQAGALLVKDLVVTGFSDGQLVAFMQADGVTAWSADLSGGGKDFVDVDSTPVLVGNLVIASCYKRGVFAVDVDTGNIAWVVKGEGYGTATVFEGQVFVPQALGSVIAIDGASGTVGWRAKLSGEIAGTPAASEHYLLVPGGESLVVLDKGTGRALSHFDDGHSFYATPELAYGTAYVLGGSGTIYALGVY